MALDIKSVADFCNTYYLETPVNELWSWINDAMQKTPVFFPSEGLLLLRSLTVYLQGDFGWHYQVAERIGKLIQLYILENNFVKS